MNYPYAMTSMQAYDEEARRRYETNLLINAATFGAVVGATGAAAVNLRRLGNDETTWQAALVDTAKVGATSAVATTAAAAVGQMFRRNPVLSFAATMAAGTAVMYALTSNTAETGDE